MGEEKGRFRLINEISVGAIITMVSMIVTVMGSYFALDARVKLMEARQAEMLLGIERQIARFEDVRSDVVSLRLAVARLEANDARVQQSNQAAAAKGK